MWIVTKKDGSVLEIDKDSNLIVYLNTVSNESDLDEIVKIERKK